MSQNKLWSRLTPLSRLLALSLTAMPIVIAQLAWAHYAPLPSRVSKDIQATEHLLPAGTPLLPAQETNQPFVFQERVTPGDTVLSLLARLGVGTISLAETEDLRRAGSRLQTGAYALVRISPEGELRQASLPLTRGERLLIEYAQDHLSTRVQKADSGQPQQWIEMRTAIIRSSLFEATDAAGIPDNITAELVQALGTHIDFSRQLWPGDRFTIIYESKHQDGFPLNTGRVLAVEYTRRGTAYRVFRYQDDNGRESFHADDGTPLHRGLLRYPLEFRRISDHFGMREKHPVLGGQRMHYGTDFAAATGTPVLAASDGKVVFAGTRKGYGNTVVIEHGKGVSTLYAHLHRIHVRPGQPIQQGRELGLVGATGWATGPHLHYEIRVEGKPRDPLKAALPMQAAPLQGEQLLTFRSRTQEMRHRLEMLGGRFAAASPS